MKKKTLLAGIILGVSLLTFTGCSNYSAKYLGGTMQLKLEPNQKLVNVTWKDDSLWYLTRPMKEDEEPEVLTFNSKSEFGILEGTVIITETK